MNQNKMKGVGPFLRNYFLACYFLFTLFATATVAAQLLDKQVQQVDAELLNSLKIEATHNLNRLKSLKQEKKNSKIFADEREKALGSYLEEQENWEQMREKGLAEYRKQKKNLSPSEEGPEYREWQKSYRKTQEQAEKTREIQVRTRNRVLQQNPGVVSRLEDEELGLIEVRPRYELRKRGQNKWIKGGASSSGSSGRGSGGGSFSGGGGNNNNFPPPEPAVDYMPAPPLDSYEEIPPPPPPPPYDYYGGGVPPPPMPYDSGYGDIPPPPPPVDYDF